jgi:hypothetical protein
MKATVDATSTTAALTSTQRSCNFFKSTKDLFLDQPKRIDCLYVVEKSENVHLL